MTLDKARKAIPPSYRIDIAHGKGFWRCTISNDLGQPKGIGEHAKPELAIALAVASYGREKK